MPSARAGEERGHNHFWNRVSPKLRRFSPHSKCSKGAEMTGMHDGVAAASAAINRRTALQQRAVQSGR